MPIVLFRVDERLIHGQVIIGWGGRLNPDRLVVIDDAIANSAWEQELYCLGVPPEMEASFVAIAGAARRFAEWETGHRRVLILVRDVDTLRRLADEVDLAACPITLGGIHHAEGRERLLPYLHLSGPESEQLRALEASGLRIAAQDLPGSKAVALTDLLA